MGTKTKPSHTPGPWKVGNQNAIYTDNHRVITISINEHPADPLEMAANARLIAAAPELLEAAKRLVSLVESKRGKCKGFDPAYCEACAVRAAIVKAEGWEAR